MEVPPTRDLRPRGVTKLTALHLEVHDVIPRRYDFVECSGAPSTRDIGIAVLLRSIVMIYSGAILSTLGYVIQCRLVGHGCLRQQGRIRQR